MINANPASEAEFKDSVTIGIPTQNNNKEILEFTSCGVLYAPNIVITAGHAGANATHILVGYNSDDVKTTDKLIKIKEKKVHDSYAVGEEEGNNGFHRRINDIQVMLLEDAVTTITPRPIADTGAVNNAATILAIGYGQTQDTGAAIRGTRQKGEIEIKHFASNAEADAYGCDPTMEFVAQSTANPPVDTCINDSGCPVYILAGGTYAIAGITSNWLKNASPANNSCGEGGIYVRVFEYKAWIDSIIAGWTAPTA